jgi:hypothetical protein
VLLSCALTDADTSSFGVKHALLARLASPRTAAMRACTSRLPPLTSLRPPATRWTFRSSSQNLQVQPCRTIMRPIMRCMASPVLMRTAGLLGYVRASFRQHLDCLLFALALTFHRRELCCLEPKNNDQLTMKEDFWLSEFDHFPELQLLSEGHWHFAFASRHNLSRFRSRAFSR